MAVTFDNCRICLQAINHEPIKMTRIILKFLEYGLQLKFVSKIYEPANAKQNLCAACFNKLSELQDFHEKCTEADDYWREEFASDKRTKLEKCMKAIEDGDDEVTENAVASLIFSSEAIQEKTAIALLNERKESHVAAARKQQELSVSNDDFLSEVVAQVSGTNEMTIHITDIEAAQIVCEDNDNENVDTCTGVEHWQHEYEEQEDGHIAANNKRHAERKAEEENQEIIGYKYVNNIEMEAPSSSTLDMENQEQQPVCYEFEEVYETCDGILQDTIEDVLGSDHTESQDEVPDQEMVENTHFPSKTKDGSGKLKKIYQCQYCDKSFHRIYDIESHYNIHTDVKPYVCDVCGKSFRQKNILTTHQALHFGKKIECPECGKKYARRSQLILHFRMHRDEKPFACDFDGCNAAFRQRQHLADHSFIHTGEKNFLCPTCDKPFHTRKRLQDHIYKVHSMHRYGCDMCEKAFLKPHMLKNHLLHTHNCEVDDVSHLKVSLDKLKKRSKKSKDFTT